MTTLRQPKALRLAEAIWPWHEGTTNNLSLAAAELRRLHAENELLHKRHHDDNAEYTRVLAQRDALLEALKKIDSCTNDPVTVAMAQVAISKAEENT